MAFSNTTKLKGIHLFFFFYFGPFEHFVKCVVRCKVNEKTEKRLRFFFCLCYVFISILWLDLHNRITSKWKNEPTIKTHQMEQPFVLHRRTFWILRSANSIETFMVKVNIIFLDFTQHKTISIHLLPFIEFTFSNFILFGK